MRFAYYMFVLANKISKLSEDCLGLRSASILTLISLLVLLLMSLILALITAPVGILSIEERAFIEKYQYSLIPYISEERELIGEFPMPCSAAYITCDYGDRTHPILGWHERHTGIDFGTIHHEDISTIADGVVEEVGIDKAFGRYVTIKHDDDERGEFYSFYAHLSVINVVENQKVKQHQVIGHEGGEPDSLDEPVGYSTGHHLHFEIRLSPEYGSDVDPEEFLSEPEDEEDEDTEE